MSEKTSRERLAIVETKMNKVENTVQRIEDKLDGFIQCSDKKYATKSELAAMAKVLTIVVAILGLIFAGVSVII